MASNSAVIADGDGQYSDWIEVYNPTTETLSLSGYYLTDDATKLTKWKFPVTASAVVAPGGYLVVFASGKATNTVPYVDRRGYIHTSFKLNAGGESVVLVAPDGHAILSSFVNYIEQIPDISYGLGANGTLGFLASPTPGAANSDAGLGWVSAPVFSRQHGFFSAPITIALSTETTDAVVRYTLDSSTPSATSGTLYEGPLEVSTTTILRAVAVKDGWFPSKVRTQTYLFPDNVMLQSSSPPGPGWPDPCGIAGTGCVGQVMDYGVDERVTSDPLYADFMMDALLAVPSISIVTDLPNLFDPDTGIYANASGSGEVWERPASVELIPLDGSAGFQVNAGLRIRGGVSVSHKNPKHSLRIISRPEYGYDKLVYPLFGPSGAQSCDKLDFRTSQNNSWQFSGPQYATYLEDPFSRDTMRDMGQPYTRGFFFHMYVDGAYWGLYQTEERPDSYFGQSYLGGSNSDYDVINVDSITGIVSATDGTTEAYTAYWSRIDRGISGDSDYFELQGLNADGTTNPAYVRYLDPDNLIDYMLLVYFTGAKDMPLVWSTKPHNMYAIYNRVKPDGFKYLSHDNELGLSPIWGVKDNRVDVTLDPTYSTANYFNPWFVHEKLRVSPEYVLRFADHVRRHFFNGGALTPEACVARYSARMDEIVLAIIAESARWGDYLRPDLPRTRNADWFRTTAWVLNNYFTARPKTRTTIVLEQLREAGLYPAIDAPSFEPQGGLVNSGGSVQLATTTGTIYYTVDGSDPRLIGGAISSEAIATTGALVRIVGTVTVKARVLEGSTWSALTESRFVENSVTAASEWQFYR